MDIEISKTRNVFTIIALAVLLAVIFDYLFFGKVIGLSVLVFTVLLVGALFWLCNKFKYNYKSSLWLIVPIIFFAIMPSIRANLFLNLLNLIAIMGLLLLGVKELLQEHITRFGLKEYFLTVFQMPLKFLLNSIKPLRFAINSFNQSSAGSWRRVVIGVLMALPVLLIFTALFSSADLAFGQFVSSIVSLNIPDTFFKHVYLMLAVFICLLGVFEYTFKASTALPVMAQQEANKKISTTGREVEASVFLSLIALLFSIFIIFQVTYLFGGEVNITNRGFTYAEYARQGFWELLAVAFTTLVILLFTDKYTHRDTGIKSWSTIPSSIIIAEILIIITSAFKRLILYQDTYGMTTLRFYVAGFIIFLGVIFILLAIKFILEKKESFFTFASLLTIIVFLAGVNLISPDSFIANKNIVRFNQIGKIDATYLAGLSADASSQILGVYDRFNDEDKIIVRDLILSKQVSWEKSQAFWQSFNFARSKAANKTHAFILEKFGPCAGIPEGQCQE
jgi:hypothetical protein